MDDIKAKQQVIEKIKASSKILVTVSNNPSVDALSAALGLTLLLDKQEKYASAIFSGEVPPAISFLEPTKTFDITTDSLRDFIIALDKEKADHLRYKIEGDSVKIFITPYKTTITQEDLEFSQGDYNVELVIALGVDNQDHLDGALENHGQILHDATVITVTAGEQTSTLGGIDWHDPQASSISEMIAGLAEALKTDKTKSLLDAPISTALLTGIVAETERFSNKHTTSSVMTVAAQLMGAGADQQLIANELANPQEATAVETSSSSTESSQEVSAKGGLSITHTEAEEPSSAYVDTTAPEVPVEQVAATNAYGIADQVNEPTIGGALNATAEVAAEEAKQAAASDQNKTILSHSYLGSDAGAAAPTPEPGESSVNETPPATGDAMHSAYAFADESTPATPAEPVVPAPIAEPAPAPEAAFVGERVIQPLSQATPDTIVALETVAPVVQPQPAPADLGLPMPPPLPDFSQPTAPPPAFPVPTVPQPGILGDILAPEAPVAAPAPEVTPVAPILEPVAPAPVQPLPTIETAPVLAPPSVVPTPPSDPGQFKIPGQP